MPATPDGYGGLTTMMVVVLCGPNGRLTCKYKRRTRSDARSREDTAVTSLSLEAGGGDGFVILCFCLLDSGCRSLFRLLQTRAVSVLCSGRSRRRPCMTENRTRACGLFKRARMMHFQHSACVTPMNHWYIFVCFHVFLTANASTRM